MDRTRIITTLEYYVRDDPISNSLRADARGALAELQADPRFAGAVVLLTRTYLGKLAQTSPELAGHAELVALSFRSGLDLGLSIAAVGEGDWEL
ncbi:MAG: hypothetical protein QM648_10945 [Solirubrobacterales bacterium]